MITRVCLDDGMQFNTQSRDFRVDPFQVGDIPEKAYFLGIEYAGIEAMLTGVLVAFLPAPFSFFRFGWHRSFFMVASISRGGVHDDTGHCNKYSKNLCSNDVNGILSLDMRDERVSEGGCRY